MKIILALDDDNGMMFNKRRQSQDVEVRKKIAEVVSGSRIWMNSYSAGQFQDTEMDLCIEEDFLDRAEQGDHCFVENVGILEMAEKIEELIIFRWNRRYPGDFHLDFLPQENGLICTGVEEFPGHSHDKITMEVWRREG